MFIVLSILTIDLLVDRIPLFVVVRVGGFGESLPLENNSTIGLMRVLIRTIFSSLSQAWQQLTGNKLRTALSLLGVSIGIFCIVAVQSAVDSLQSNVVDSLSKLGDNTLYIQKMPWAEDPGRNYWKYARRPNFTYDEYKALNQGLKEVGEAGYYAIVGGRTAKWRNNNVEGVFSVAGSPELADFFGMEFGEGRFFTSSEFRLGSNVVVLGYETAQQLFGNVEATGREIQMFGQKLTVVGVLEKSGEDLLQVFNFDQAAIFSYPFMAKSVNLESTFFFSSLMAKPIEDRSKADLIDAVTMNMRAERRLKPVEDDNFSVNSLSIITGVLDSVFSTLNVVGFVIGLFAILVGGFSVANIMFVSVKERTSLIGVKMALGASRPVILLEFLIESMALCLIGGMFGLLLVFAVITILNTNFPFVITLSIANMLTGTVLALIIGIFSGIIPAFMASRMDPVTAIRS